MSGEGVPTTTGCTCPASPRLCQRTKKNPAEAGFSWYLVRLPKQLQSIDAYSASTASACRPFWPWVTVKLTFWPSCRDLKP